MEAVAPDAWPHPSPARAWRSRLETAVRAALPALACRAQEVWQVGECALPDEEGDPTVKDFHLRWRMTEDRMEALRATTFWRFEGQAMVLGHPVDFMGTCGRDRRSGAFMRFGIQYVGGPREP